MPFIKVPNGSIFYKDSPASDPPSSKATLILHHGLGSTHSYHQPVVSALTAAPYNFRCVSYDAISCGISSLSDGPQSIETVAEDVIAVMDGLRIPKAVFVGHSFAGIVAAHLAVTKSDRIMASVMLGPVLPSENVASTFEARVRTIEESESFEERVLSRNLLMHFSRGYGGHGGNDTYRCNWLEIHGASTCFHKATVAVTESKRSTLSYLSH